MYKILISDFENTLIDEEDAIPLSTMLAIDKIRSCGIAYGIISKKSFKTVMDYNKDFPFLDYIIVLNGAYVYDVNKDKPLYKKNITTSIIKKIKKVFEEYNLCFYTLDYCNYTKDIVPFDNARKIGDFKVFSKFHKDNIFKIDIRCSSKADQSKILNVLEELDLNIRYQAKKDSSYYVEIFMKDCSLLAAIEEICKAREASKNETIIVGSSDDNAEVFKRIGKSYAVLNASNKLKKVASNITVSNLDKAVEVVIKESFNDASTCQVLTK